MAQKITAADIKLKMMTDDRWLYRGILAIYERQTFTEQAAGDTIEDNGVGFNGVDARKLSEFAEDIKKYGDLFDWKKTVARKKMLKYAGQLADIAKSNGYADPTKRR